MASPAHCALRRTRLSSSSTRCPFTIFILHSQSQPRGSPRLVNFGHHVPQVVQRHVLRHLWIQVHLQKIVKCQPSASTSVEHSGGGRSMPIPSAAQDAATDAAPKQSAQAGHG